MNEELIQEHYILTLKGWSIKENFNKNLKHNIKGNIKNI